MSNTLKKVKIIENLHNSIGLSKSECSLFVEDFIDKVLIKLKKDEIVKIANFGSFIVKNKNDRIGRNPKTKEEVIITARKVVKFKPSNLLLSKINKS